MPGKVLKMLFYYLLQSSEQYSETGWILDEEIDSEHLGDPALTHNQWPKSGLNPSLPNSKMQPSE